MTYQIKFEDCCIKYIQINNHCHKFSVYKAYYKDSVKLCFVTLEFVIRKLHVFHTYQLDWSLQFYERIIKKMLLFEINTMYLKKEQKM